jgi:hypothetical protein
LEKNSKKIPSFFQTRQDLTVSQQLPHFPRGRPIQLAGYLGVRTLKSAAAFVQMTPLDGVSAGRQKRRKPRAPEKARETKGGALSLACALIKSINISISRAHSAHRNL